MERKGGGSSRRGYRNGRRMNEQGTARDEYFTQQRTVRYYPLVIVGGGDLC